jgi:transcriptional regulator GlxA family with amidase domain
MSVTEFHSERGFPHGNAGRGLPVHRPAGEARPKPDVVVSELALRRLLQTADTALDGDPARARDCIARALQLLRPAMPGTSAGTPQQQQRGGLAPWQARKLAAYIAANAGEEIRGADLARMVALSNSHFIRAFRASFGETPHAYVIRQRLLKAQIMMLQSREPLARIAVACGFADQAHFCRRFRAATGLSPQDWRSRRGQAAAAG